MNKIGNKIKNENGISIIESIWIIAFIALFISIIGPLFRGFMIGNPPGEGFAGRIIESQTRGVDESSHSNITLSPGCDELTIPNCQAVNN